MCCQVTPSTRHFCSDLTVKKKFFSAGSPSALAGELSAVVLHANGLGWLKPVLQPTRPTASCTTFAGKARNCQTL
jgi:hypothetical protein